MKFETTLLSVTALSSLAAALVIPEFREDKGVEKSETSKSKSKGISGYVKSEKKKPCGHANSLDNVKDTPEQQEVAPLSVNGDISTRVPHKYIIVFKKDVSADEVDFHKELVSLEHAKALGSLSQDDPFFSATAGKTNEYGIKAHSLEGGIQDAFKIADSLSGYIGYFPEKVIDFIRRSPLVEFVEEDSMVFSNSFNTQNGAPWGLARISHREKLNLGSFNKYLYDDDAGKGVTAYVVDTGVNVDHKDFGGRAKWGKTIPQGDPDVDGNGHGTHCAGTIGSEHYGVAKNADIVAVKVLRSNGSGTMSDVVKGVEYVADAHKKASSNPAKGFKGSTANMSLGGGKSPALDLAVNAAVTAGVHFAVAAGNENQDACNTSPAAAENPITVGASTLSDERAYFSNWGKCVDIFGPGLNILSTYIGSDTATATLSGTSMATPHVVGLLTYFLSLQPTSDSEFFHAAGGITPAQLKKKIVDFSTKNVLTDIPEDTVNYLIYNGGGQDLDSFWGKSMSEEDSPAASAPSDFSLENLINSLDSKTDAIFEDVRHLLDQFNII